VLAVFKHERETEAPHIIKWTWSFEQKEMYLSGKEVTAAIVSLVEVLNPTFTSFSQILTFGTESAEKPHIEVEHVIFDQNRTYVLRKEVQQTCVSWLTI
jgi:hypothetical protein